jgi:purine-binding chemotaxis protein CheW
VTGASSGERTKIVRAAGERAARVEEGGTREFLGFMLADETYALPLSCIREILRMPAVAEVPRAAPEVLGIVSVRGQVTTLIDLRHRLSLPKAALGPRTRVLLVDQGDETLGLLCDRVLSVYRLGEAEVELATVLGSESSSYVMGIGRPGARKAQRSEAALQEILILLDPIALLKRHGHG